MEMMMKTLALLLLLAAPAMADEVPDTSWHLLEKSYDGKITGILHGLSKHECEFARARIMGLPATQAEIDAQKAREDDFERKERQFVAAHGGCPKGIVSTDAPESHQERNGECVIGGEMTSVRSFGSSDTETAECFQ